MDMVGRIPQLDDFSDASTSVRARIDVEGLEPGCAVRWVKDPYDTSWTVAHTFRGCHTDPAPRVLLRGPYGASVAPPCSEVIVREG